MNIMFNIILKFAHHLDNRTEIWDSRGFENFAENQVLYYHQICLNFNASVINNIILLIYI